MTGMPDIGPGPAAYEIVRSPTLAGIFETRSQWIGHEEIGSKYGAMHYRATSAQTTAEMLRAATNFMRTHPVYHFIGCNCGDLVHAVASIADPNFPDTVNPTTAFDYLLQNDMTLQNWLDRLMFPESPRENRPGWVCVDNDSRCVY